MAIKVINIKGTGKNARQISGSWLEYWEEQSGRNATRCLAYDEDPTREKDTVYNCGKTENLVGGHVKKKGSSDNRWYILPICSSHNHLNGEFWAREKDLILATND